MKLLALAEGRGFIPRFNLTYERDTAAGHALVLGAGGSFTGLDSGEFLDSKEDLRNPTFVLRSREAFQKICN